LNDSIYATVDEIAKFPDKYGFLQKYIAEHLIFPDISRESGICGTVYVRFVITSTGEVINLEVLKGVDPLYDIEALKVIVSLPDFEPGKVKGISVNSYYAIPIKFILN